MASRRGVTVPGILGVLVLGVFVVILLWLCLPSWLLASDPRTTYLKPKEYFDTVNNIRANVVQAAGILATLLAVIVAWNQFLSTRKQASETNAATLHQLELARSAHIADRFTKAVDQLGHAEADVRIGGIYALGQIMQENNAQDYREPILEILTAYLREHHPWAPLPDRDGTVTEDMTNDLGWPGGRKALRPPADVHAVSSTLRRFLVYSPETRPPVLSIGRVDLRHVDFTGIDLRQARLQGSNLSWAGLSDAHLEDARLEGGCLTHAEMWGTHFDRAHLDAVHLTGSRLVDPKDQQRRAVFDETDIRAADFTDAEGLDEAYAKEIVARLDDRHIGTIPDRPEFGETRPQVLMDAYAARTRGPT